MIHFGKQDDNYLYKFSIQDQLLYKYNILDNPTEEIYGNIKLELNVGFNNVVYSELSQVRCEEYGLKISLYQMSDQTLNEIGTTEINLDSNFLGLLILLLLKINLI